MYYGNGNILTPTGSKKDRALGFADCKLKAGHFKKAVSPKTGIVSKTDSVKNSDNLVNICKFEVNKKGNALLATGDNYLFYLVGNSKVRF